MAKTCTEMMVGSIFVFGLLFWQSRIFRFKYCILKQCIDDTYGISSSKCFRGLNPSANIAHSLTNAPVSDQPMGFWQLSGTNEGRGFDWRNYQMSYSLGSAHGGTLGIHNDWLVRNMFTLKIALSNTIITWPTSCTLIIKKKSGKIWETFFFFF